MPEIEPYAEAIGIRTKSPFSGIRAALTLPFQGDVGAVANFNEACVHYFNFYLGIDDLIEGGLSYSKKYSPPKFDRGAWRKFLNPGQPSIPSTVSFGKSIKLELTTDNGEVFLKQDGDPVGSYKGIGTGHVKMVIAVADAVPKGKPSQVWFASVIFASVELRVVGAKEWQPAKQSDFQPAHHVSPQGRASVMVQGSGFLSASIAQTK